MLEITNVTVGFNAQFESGRLEELHSTHVENLLKLCKEQEDNEEHRENKKRDFKKCRDIFDIALKCSADYIDVSNSEKTYNEMQFSIHFSSKYEANTFMNLLMMYDKGLMLAI